MKKTNVEGPTFNGQSKTTTDIENHPFKEGSELVIEVKEGIFRIIKNTLTNECTLCIGNNMISDKLTFEEAVDFAILFDEKYINSIIALFSFMELQKNNTQRNSL